LNETLIGLVGEYSPSGNEGGAVCFLVERMQTLGYDRAFRDEAGNAVGVIGNGPRQIVLLGHIDTVPGEILVRVEDGILYGRGAVDAKGPLACFTDAAAACGAAEGWQLVVIGAVEEERDSKGAYFVVNQYQPEYAIIGEPNRWDRTALGYKGTAWVEIKIRQGMEHTASGGTTASESGVIVWQSIKTFCDAYNTDKTRVFDQLQPSLQEIHSDHNDFEQWANLRVGVRLPPAFSPEEWYAKLEELTVGAEVVRLGVPLAAYTCDKNTRLVRAVLAGIRGEGGTPAFVYKTGTADLNVVAPVWGCPALVYGPGDSALDHTPDERIELGEYEKAVRVLTSALKKLMEE
jgi:LysW-gamma-L-lysine carboxypeptidase